MGRPMLPRELERAFWVQVAAGLAVHEAAVATGVSVTQAKRWFRQRGGVRPRAAPAGPRKRPRLSLAEREDIACSWHSGRGVREIARELGRAPSTVSRELRRGISSDRRTGYRASVAQGKADWRARRPKESKLAGNARLCRQVQDWLEDEHSPEQIAGRLKADFPDDAEMRVSHEAIYLALYVQGRGHLRRDLHQRLRTGRALRKPHRTTEQRRGRIAGMVNIAERPPEVEDRAVPGHWEGDLILGTQAKTAIGTLVERTTGYVLLLHLPGSHGAGAVQEAMVEQMSRLPDTLRRTLTWDQGAEMRNHAQIAEATGLDIYFCDPHSPWQRGSNENTNGLLRQYFPKGADLSVFAPDYLDHVAMKLNNRPRKRHGWQTPAETLDQLLSEPTDRNGVASTA